MTPMPEDSFLPPHGNYAELFSYQKAEIVYDLTFRFCQRLLAKGDRTIDQMVQAARSGKQNIVEGSKASVTSKETEIKLTNVARASLEELLADYTDFLRVRDLKLWAKDSKEAQYVRRLGNRPHLTYEAYREFCETRPAEVVANIALCLIHQTNYLLDQQIRRLEKDFVNEGGLRERMTRARLQYRNKIPTADNSPESHKSHESHTSHSSDQPSRQPPDCPLCAKPMALRTAQQGKRAGSQFWGCTAYPTCKGTRRAEAGDPQNRNS
jgi:four helix bundle suffix protein